MSAERNIVLIGMRCSGKTTLGRALAERLGRAFTDLDEVLAQRAGLPADEVLARDGEPAFRRLEEQVLRWAATLEGHVIATGGGAVVHERTFATLAGTGTVIYLEASAAELIRRGLGRHQPPLTVLSRENEVETLLSVRDPMYREAAQFTIPVDRTDPILDLLAALGGSDRP
ncbi:MAG: shikimate kinase [Planctomycetota bacterium]|jgi:shikimate kinase